MSHGPTPTPPNQDSQVASGVRYGGRLVRRTFLIAVLLVCGGLLSSAALELFFRYRESVEAIGVLQRQMAQGVAFKIQQFVHDITQTLRVSTQTQEITTAAPGQSYTFALRKVLTITPAITAIVALDANGREHARVSRLRLLPADERRESALTMAFQGVQNGQPFFGPVYFLRESEPYMTIAVPIERFVGEVVGALVAEVNLKYIWEVVFHLQVGQTGYAYVVSREGDLIAHPDMTLVLQKRRMTHLSQIQAALAGTPEALAAQPNLIGQQVFATSASIPTLGWAVLVERPVAEAYAPLYASLLRTAMLLLLGLGIAVLTSLLIMCRVLRPLMVLQHGAERLGSGDLAYRLTLNTGDEFQTLANAFNGMASQLQASHANLTQQVVERTRALARSVQELQALDEISQVMNSSLDVHTVLTTIVTYAVQLSGAAAAAVYAYDEATQALSLRLAQGLTAEVVTTLRSTTLHLGEDIVGQAAARRQPMQLYGTRTTADSAVARRRWLYHHAVSQGRCGNGHHPCGGFDSLCHARRSRQSCRCRLCWVYYQAD